jgi:DNA-binding CsgD family transcriptional regulator
MPLPCPRCGRATRPDAHFCDGCGLALPGGEAPGRDAEPGSGRESELARIDECLQAALAGRGSTVALCGEPGIGKSHTAQEAARRAAALGLQVFWGRCNEEPGAPPYWPWQQVLQAWVAAQPQAALRDVPQRAIAAIADLVPELAGRLPSLRPLPAGGDALQARFRLFEGIGGFWRHATQSQPTMLVLDNVHWADASSLKLLEFLAPELASLRLLLLVTYRDMELSRQHPLSGTLGELSARCTLHRLRLVGLARAHTARMLARAAGSAVANELVDEVHRRTEGNPLFVGEMARLLLQEGLLAGTPSRLLPPQRIPEGIREVIGRRLNRLSDRTNQVLACASIFGRQFDAHLLAPVLDDIDDEACALALEEALSARILEALPGPGRYRFGHALFRETLYEEIAPPRRSRLHLRVARTLEARAAGSAGLAAALAYQYGAALPGGDPVRAVDWARRAADQASALQAHEEAARYLRLSLQGMEVGGEFEAGLRCALLNALGEALTHAGEYLPALHAFEQAAQLAQREDRASELARAALGYEIATWCPGLPGMPAARLLRDALDAAPATDVATTARLLSALTRALIYSGEEAQAMQVHAQALATARRCGDPRIVASTLVATLSARWQHERQPQRLAAAEEARQLALAVGDRALAVDASAWALFDLFELGDLRAWRAGMEEYERNADELREPFPLYVGACSRTMHALLEGRFDDAEQLARAALALGERMPGLDAAGVYGVQMFTLRREQGRLAEVAPAVQLFVQDGGEAHAWRPGLALIHAELGQLEEARREFEVLAVNDFVGLARDGVWAASTAYLAEVCAMLGDAARAERLYALLRPYSGCNLLAGTSIACVGAADLLLARLAFTQRHWDAAERHFQAALAFNAQQGARPGLAHTRLHYAAMLLARNRAGDRAQAASLLLLAAAEASALGMRGVQACVAALQEQAGAAPALRSYPAGLSEREVQVLAFVAAGKSNRQIAQALFVSPNTVANHVRSILGKTQCTNRTEAAAFAIRNALAQPGLPSRD